MSVQEIPGMAAPTSTPSSKAKPAKPAREDHRVRVAREKRERMRAHLFQSVLSVCSGQSPTSAAVIDDVVRHAEVSRGTFYKYFGSLEQAVEQLALQLADEMTAGIASVHEAIENPVLRTATGFLTFLARALIEPGWGAFITHIGLLSGDDNLITTKIKSDIRLGVETGDYAVKSVDLAADLLMGAKVEAIRRIIGGGQDSSYIRGMAEMVLRSFGVSPRKAMKSVERAWDQLHEQAPGKISWWREAALLGKT